MRDMIKVGQELEGIINMNLSGSAYFSNIELPREIYIYKTNTNKALHLDLVKIKVVKGKGRELEGIVSEVIKRVKHEYVGTIKISPEYAFLIPDSNKMPVDIFVPIKKLNGAKDGEKVVVRIKDWTKSKNPNGEVVKVLGNAGNNEVEMHSILHEYDLPYDFDEDVIAESEVISEEIKASEIAERRDMRNVMTLTIDPEDAKDFDDALSVDWSFGNIQVGVHIADVSHYLRPDTDLDKEAYRRGTSVYLVDRVIPMLPERLSNGICSLRPNEDKLCFSAVFTLDRNGAIVDEWFGKTIINSNYRYTYETAQQVIEEGLSKHDKTTDVCIMDLDHMAKILRKQRLKDSSLTFDKSEIKFKLDENNKPAEIIFKTSKDSNKLIEEFMLLANKRVAHVLRTHEYPVVQRVHEEPAPEKLAQLKNFIKQFDYDIKINTPQEITKTLNRLLEDIKGKPEENLISNLVVRTMQKAFYTTKNLGHYGLGFEDYAHFTSPIRRYPDIMVHRLLSRYLSNKPVPKLERLEQKCIHLSKCEISAQKAERDSQKYMQAVYMSSRIGNVYEGIVTSITEYGLFVEIIENGCNGMIKVMDIQGDTFVTDMNNYQVKGQNTGQVIRLGDPVSVIIDSVDIERKNINLSII